VIADYFSRRHLFAAAHAAVTGTPAPLPGIPMKTHFAALALSLILPLYASATHLDPTYGNKGALAYGFDRVAGGYDLPGGAAIDATGRMWVAGGVQVASSGTNRYRWGALWLTPRGQPDFNLSVEGALVYAMPQPWQQNNSWVDAVAFDAQGRFLVALHTQPDATMTDDTHVHVCRMTAVGSYDTSFGINGCTEVLFDAASTAEIPYKVMVQPDGKILVAGTSRVPNGILNRAAVARLDDHGSYDGSFGPLAPNGGSRVLSWPATTGASLAPGMILTADGGCLVAAPVSRNVVPNAGIGLAKLTASGALDIGFSQDGYAVPLFTDSDQTPVGSSATALLQLPGGDFLIGGTTPVLIGNTLAGLLRITPNGVPNPNFGSNGSLLFAFGDVFILNKVSVLALDSAGRVVLAGTAHRDIGNTNREVEVGVARLSQLGTFDPSFGVDGLYNFEVEPYAADARASDFANTLILRGDAIYIAGSTSPQGAAVNDSNYFVAKIDDGLIFDDGFDD
jgi:uncharacterized delta-60 repeat protein